jgi:dipeptidyl aminopeptidase/acylaminoacyl peptidase
MLPHRRRGLVTAGRVRPHWIGDGSTFWFELDVPDGREYAVATPDDGRLDRGVDPANLPRGEDRGPVSEVRSPDGAWSALVRDHDVWIRSTQTGAETRLTHDGTADRAYATVAHWPSPHLLRRLGITERPPLLSWSPTSTHILTHRVDLREVGTAHLVESAPAGGGKPLLHSSSYALPGESRPRGEWVVIDVRAGGVAVASEAPFVGPYSSPLSTGRAWWATDGSVVYVVDLARDMHRMSLLSIDPVTGAVHRLIDETAATRIEPSPFLGDPPIVHVISPSEVLWYSQRDGWGHLYLDDIGSGAAPRRVTSGEIQVREILHVDAVERVAFLTVAGLSTRDPYTRALVRVGLDDGAFENLTPDDLDHEIVAPAHGRWFVDSASYIDQPPITTVVGRDGSRMLELARADHSRLVAAGWSAPERVRTIAADGVTPIYGMLIRPHGFDPARRYPVVEHTYPGPQVNRVRSSFRGNAYGDDTEALAALGFVVVAFDGRGTPGRDKAFHDHAFRNLADCGGQDDHVAALGQLAATRPWMDLDRVGIFGHSGGGFATATALLRFPDVYRVGVSIAGNHDNRVYNATWAEDYDDGPFDETSASRLSNLHLAANLRGQLLLIHGDLDDNVLPSQTMRLVDALVAADKDFDLLIVPGAEHSLHGFLPYVHRRTWDYFVRHLMGATPPSYRLADIPLDDELADLLLG